MWLQEVELEGKYVRLIPLRHNHTDGLIKAARDGRLWDLWFTSVPDADHIFPYIERAIEDHNQGLCQAFAVVDKSSFQIVGTTRFCNAVPQHHRLEIGYTWYAASFQRTYVNTETKYLMLHYAFSELNCIAVELRTHFQNFRSRRAIERLGAKQDGILRNHQIDSHGNIRDTVVYSILNSEWPTCKFGLEHKLYGNYYRK